MKYAIVEHSGKQYLAQEGGLIEVDRMQLEVGKSITFKEVLLITDGKKVEVGTPFVKGATVKGKVQDHLKGKKVTVFKYKPKQRYRRTQGHRQQLTHVSIESIGLPKAEPKKKAEPKTEKKKKSEATAKKSGKSAAKKSSESTAKKSSSSSAKKSSTGTKKKSSSTASKKQSSKSKSEKKD